MRDGRDWLGKVFGDYRIEAFVEARGEDLVFRGVAVSSGAAVAVRVYPPEAHIDRARLVAAARSLQSVRHAGVAGVLDVFEVGEAVVLVLERVEGVPLAEVLKRGAPLDPQEAIDILVPVLEALERLGSAGLRSPPLDVEEVVVQADGTARLAIPPLPVRRAQSLTECGGYTGDFRYLSPEAVTGRETSPASAAFSAGAVLYHLTTGKAPFADESALGTMKDIVKKQPAPPAAVAPGGTAPALDRAILAALEKDPSARPAGPGALAQELRRLRPQAAVEDSTVLLDSDAEKGKAESSDELILDESTSDTVLNIGDIMAPEKQKEEIVFSDSTEAFQIAPHPSDPEAKKKGEKAEAEATKVGIVQPEPEPEPELATTLDRRATVRHYSQINPGRTYPLLVVISEGRIERVTIEGVSQVESERSFAVKAANPFVRVEPVLAGCAVAPASIDLDVRKKVAEARFLVAPIVEGEVPDARVEIRYEGAIVDAVPIPTRVARQTVAKVSATLSVVAPLALKALPFLGGSAGDGRGAVLHAAAAAGGPLVLGLLCAGALAAVAVVFYLRNRAREAEPVVRFFDYATAGRAPDDLAIARRKARLVVLAEGERREVPLDVAEVTIGGDPGAAIALRDPSVGWRHATLRFDGHSFRIAPAPGPDAGPIRLEGRPIAGATLLPDREALVEVGRVALWYYRAVPDPDLDGPEARARLADALVRAVPGHEARVRAALAPPRPVREAAAALMVAGCLDAATFRQAVELARAGVPA